MNKLIEPTAPDEPVSFEDVESDYCSKLTGGVCANPPHWAIAVALFVGILLF